MSKTKNKEIFNFCPNYDYIVNAPITDELSLNLIERYKDIIFATDVNNLDHIQIIYKLDKIMFQFVDDYYFGKELKKNIINNNIDVYNIENIDGIVNGLLDFDNKYVEISYRNLENTMWV